MDYDVAIIGSGPAGSSAAYFLSNSGLHIAVIERLSDDPFKRYHTICGGGVSKNAFKDLPLNDNEILNHVDRIGLTFPDGKHIYVKHKGFVIDRCALISRIRTDCIKDGIEYITGSVTSITKNEGYLIKTTNGEFTSKYIIGADGAFSVVRKDLFGSSPRECIPVMEYIIKGTEDSLEFTVGPQFQGGYQWRFPNGDDVCIGSTKEIKEDEFLFRGTRFIPTGGVGDIVKGNALLIGDAAGMPNPASYGGLKMAILSGKIAAEAIISEKPETLNAWWKKSVYSDERFVKLHEYIKDLPMEEFNVLSKPLTSKNFWINGIKACLRRPKLGWLYFGCLFAFKHGW